MNVSSILRRKRTWMETADVRTAAGQAARRLAERGVGSLVIVDGQRRLLGVLRDYARARP